MNKQPIFSHIRLYRQSTDTWLTYVLDRPCVEEEFADAACWADEAFPDFELFEFMTGYCTGHY